MKAAHKLVLEFSGNDMLRIYEASKGRGLSMEDWAGAIISAAAADIAQRSRRPSTAPSSDERQHAIQQAAEFPAEIADDADRQPLADKR